MNIRCALIGMLMGLLGPALTMLVWLLQAPAGTLGIFLTYLFPGLLLPLNDPSLQIWKVIINVGIFLCIVGTMLIGSDQPANRLITVMGLWLGLSIFLWRIGFVSTHLIDIAEMAFALAVYLGFAMLLNRCARATE